MQPNGPQRKSGHSGDGDIIHIPRWVFLVSIAAFFLLLLLVWLVFVEKNNQADQYVFGQLQPAISPAGIRFMKTVTYLGTHRFLIPANLVLIGFLLSRKKQRAALVVTVVALSSWGLMSVLKNSFQRHRPDFPLLEGITNYSFPSGHAMMSLACYGLLMGMAGYYFPAKKAQQVFIAFLGILIALIGFSRIYLRVHYASDVLAGYCFGLVWMCLSVLTVRYFQGKRH